MREGLIEMPLGYWSRGPVCSYKKGANRKVNWQNGSIYAQKRQHCCGLCTGKQADQNILGAYDVTTDIRVVNGVSLNMGKNCTLSLFFLNRLKLSQYSVPLRDTVFSGDLALIG